MKKKTEKNSRGWNVQGNVEECLYRQRAENEIWRGREEEEISLQSKDEDKTPR